VCVCVNMRERLCFGESVFACMCVCVRERGRVRACVFPGLYKSYQGTKVFVRIKEMIE